MAKRGTYLGPYAAGKLRKYRMMKKRGVKNARLLVSQSMDIPRGGSALWRDRPATTSGGSVSVKAHLREGKPVQAYTRRLGVEAKGLLAAYRGEKARNASGTPRAMPGFLGFLGYSTRQFGETPASQARYAMRLYTRQGMNMAKSKGGWQRAAQAWGRWQGRGGFADRLAGMKYGGRRRRR